MPAEKIITKADQPSWKNRAWRAIRLTSLFAAAAGVVIGGHHEATTSTLQSKIFGEMARGELFTTLSTGAPPARGPQDIRRGYDRTAAMRNLLTGQHYDVTPQIPWPDTNILGLQLQPVDLEKAQAGLILTDSNGHILHDSPFPRQAYSDFASIPPLVWRTLAFVEDQQAAEQDRPATFNPVINIPRLGVAIGKQAARFVGLDVDDEGGSTLPTQFYKFSHSPGGATASGEEKLWQIASAMRWRYSFGDDLKAAQKESILRYLNGMPLSARKGQGEIIGLADGLESWFRTNFAEANRILSTPDDALDDSGLQRKAEVARQAISLIMAVKKPTDYLTTSKGREELRTRVDSYLGLLADAGVFSPSFANMIRHADPGFTPPPPPAASQPKWQIALQTELMQMLGARSLHDLDKYDVSAHTTLDGAITDQVQQFLIGLTDPETAKAHGLIGPRLLREDQVGNVIYSFSLSETNPDGKNVLRVQADNFSGELNLNTGSKLELGSTAKMRVLATYLETVGRAFEHLSPLSLEQRRQERSRLQANQKNSVDTLTTWVLDYLDDSLTEKTQDAILEAAMNRHFSANPGAFWTAEGRHTFSNFDRKTGGSMDVWAATERSVNLVFIRMLEEIRNYATYQVDAVDPGIYDSADHPQRKAYLERFIDDDGADFLRKFWNQQKDKMPEELAVFLAGKTYRLPQHLAIVYRTVFPDAPVEDMNRFISAHCKGNCKASSDYQDQYEKYAPGKFNLADLAYVSGLHPLELGLVMLRNFREAAPTKENTLTFLAAQTRRTPDHLALVYRTFFPEAPYQDTEAFIHANCGYCAPLATFHDHYDRYAPGWQPDGSSVLSADAYLQELMRNSYQDAFAAIPADNSFESAAATLQIATHESYRWLEKSKRKQDLRIGIMLEKDAFRYVDSDWAETGYSFTVKPSLATAIGASADVPADFAAFLQTLQHDGVKYHTYSFDKIQLGENTYHAFNAAANPGSGKRIMPAKVAELVLRAMRGVVENPNGTARRLFQAARLSDGRILTIAGKTGTGDNKDGEKTKSRVAAFNGVIGLGEADRFAVTMTVYVPGQDADDYDFTSGLAAQIVKALLPILQPLFDRAYPSPTLISTSPERETAQAMPAQSEASPVPVVQTF